MLSGRQTTHLRQYIQQEIAGLLQTKNIYKPKQKFSKEILSTQFMRSHQSITWTEFKRSSVSCQMGKKSLPHSNYQELIKKKHSVFYRRLITSEVLLNQQPKVQKTGGQTEGWNKRSGSIGDTLQSRGKSRSRIIVSSRSKRASTCLDGNELTLQSSRVNKYLSTKQALTTNRSPLNHLKTSNL